MSSFTPDGHLEDPVLLTEVCGLSVSFCANESFSFCANEPFSICANEPFSICASVSFAIRTSVSSFFCACRYTRSELKINYVNISIYIITKMYVCLFVCLLTFLSAILKSIGIPFVKKLLFAPGKVLTQKYL